MKWIVQFIAAALTLALLPQFVEGFVVADFYTALWVALALGVANLIVRPILLLLTLPLTILTLGLFTFVVNALIIWGVATFIPIEGFSVDGFVPALIAALILAAVHWMFGRMR